MTELDLILGAIGGAVGFFLIAFAWYSRNRSKLRNILSEFMDVLNAVRDGRPFTEIEQQTYEFLVALTTIIPVEVPNEKEPELVKPTE